MTPHPPSYLGAPPRDRLRSRASATERSSRRVGRPHPQGEGSNTRKDGCPFSGERVASASAPLRVNCASGVRRRGLFYLTPPLCCLLSAFLLAPRFRGAALQSSVEASSSPSQDSAQEPGLETPPASDWAPELFDGIISSPNPEARRLLLDAAFAAGPAIIPQLQVALKDDRTAEFAAQSLAFIGGEQALPILAKLVDDPRDLNLRRFYYGALGEFDDPRAAQALLYVVGRSNDEPDRTVTEAALMALTVRSEESLLGPLRQAEAKTRDIVIRDDVDNAIEVIQGRARYLASPEGKRAGGSIDQAVHLYFVPAFAETAAAGQSPRATAVHSKAGKGEPPPQIEIHRITFGPNQLRALAHVTFEGPSAAARYTMVLQRQLGNWRVVSVWLGSEQEKALPAPPVHPSP